MTLIELLTYVKDAGILAAPLFAVMWWLERDERKDAQRELKDVAQTTAIALNEMKMMIGQLISIFDRPRGRGRE